MNCELLIDPKKTISVKSDTHPFQNLKKSRNDAILIRNYHVANKVRMSGESFKDF